MKVVKTSNNCRWQLTAVLPFWASKRKNVTTRGDHYVQPSATAWPGGGVLMPCMAVVYSRTTIDPRIPTTPGRSASGFHRPRQTLRIAPSFAKHREVLGESHEGWAASYQGPLLRRTCTWMTASNGSDIHLNRTMTIFEHATRTTRAMSSPS